MITMIKRIIFQGILLLVLLSYPAYVTAEEEILDISDEESASYVMGKYRLADKIEKWRNDIIEKYGTDFAFLINTQYQKILQSEEFEGKGKWAEYHGLSIRQKLPLQDFYLISNIAGGSGKGIDKFTPVFSIFNDAAGEPCNIYVSKFYFEKGFNDNKIIADIGKLDLSSWFDANQAAFSSDEQFLSSALSNNRLIPFPQKGFGARLFIKPNELFYFQTGMANANAVKTKIGLSDAFSGAYFLIGEFGISVKIKDRAGNYRFIFFGDIEELNKLNGEGTQQNDFGFALSFDQDITKKIKLFLRYGNANKNVSIISNFLSAGAQFEGIIPGRKNDLWGIGMARSFISSDYRDAEGPGIGNAETMYETYYNIKLHPFFSIIPNLQYVTYPLGQKDIKDEFAIGIRFVLLI